MDIDIARNPDVISKEAAGEPGPQEAEQAGTDPKVPSVEPDARTRGEAPGEPADGLASAAAPDSPDSPDSMGGLPLTDESGEPLAPAEAPADSAEEVMATRLGPGQKKSDEELLTEAAALLFAASDPMTPARLQKLLERPEGARVKQTLDDLGERLSSSDLPIVLKRIAGGYRLMSDPAVGEVLARLKKDPKPDRITGAALETLAIVAYRQPVTKAEVEAIRGVQAGPMLRNLVDRGLVRITGRADLPGSPLQYGTTREFLDRFGLGGLKDLPRDGELSES